MKEKYLTNARIIDPKNQIDEMGGLIIDSKGSIKAVGKKVTNGNLPTSTEMIMGLPGETYKSWIDGLGSLLDSNINNQIFVYQAEIYPNTELNEQSYRKKHGIKTLKIELQETHCSPKEQKWLKEYQEIVIETSTMSKEDWKKRNLFSVVLMVFHSFKVAFYIMNYLKNEMQISGKDFVKFICDNVKERKHPTIYSNLIKKIDNWTNDILKGKARSVYEPKHSDVYLDIEEIIFIGISEKFKLFYSELKDLVKDLVGRDNWKKNHKIINEIFMYQDLRIPRANMNNLKLHFNYNIAEYMFGLVNDKRIILKKYANTVQTLNTKNYGNNYWEFTKKKIIWARKNDKIKNEIDYDNKAIKKIEKRKIYKMKYSIKKHKVNMFDELNKFKKYDSLDIKG